MSVENEQVEVGNETCEQQVEEESEKKVKVKNSNKHKHIYPSDGVQDNFQTILQESPINPIKIFLNHKRDN